MGIQKRSRNSSDSENWDTIFKSFAKILRRKEDEYQSLCKHWTNFEKRVKTQHDNLLFDVQRYKDQLSLMKEEIETLEMMRLVDNVKFNLLLGLKERDLSVCKSNLEETQDELDDFKAFRNWKDAKLESLEGEIRKLKVEFEKLKKENEEIFQLRLSNHEKDKIISRLMANQKKKDDEISRPSSSHNEVKPLRRSRRLAQKQ